MRLGLIGTGKQGQRYLMEKNGGRHIKVSGSRRIPLDEVDGVIIATHPAGHKELALECIAAGKAVLIEKPLALNLADCEEILDAAERAGVPCEVAHTRLWSKRWFWVQDGTDVTACARYESHARDYSPWLDWAPHCIAMLATARSTMTPQRLRESVCMIPGEPGGVTVNAGLASYTDGPEPIPPMFLMVRDFIDKCRQCPPPMHWKHRIDFNRRVYRALFAED